MRRLVAVIVVVAALGAVIAEGVASSSARGRAAGQAVVTPRLKLRLSSEIARLRAGQPRAPRVLALPRLPLNPERGIRCFVAGGPLRCSEIPCREFVNGGAVYAPSVTVTRLPTAGPVGKVSGSVGPTFGIPPGAAKLRITPAGPTVQIAPGALRRAMAPRVMRGIAPGTARAIAPPGSASIAVPPALRRAPACHHRAGAPIPIAGP